jgi:hypothetical protein
VNGKHRLLRYADYVNLLKYNIDTINKDIETLIYARKEVGLEINIEKAMYKLLSHPRMQELNWNIIIVNTSSEDVAQFKYFEMTVTNENLIQEESKRILNSGNASYHSVQNLLSSCPLLKNLKIRIKKTIIFSLVLYGCET